MLPREVFGKSTFEMAVMMMKWLPIWVVDKILLMLAWLVFGNIEKYGLKRPLEGPLEMKNKKGKTPVLDIGTLDKIRSGHIKVVPGIKRFTNASVELINGQFTHVDAVILATGYRSNVPSWLQVRIMCYSILFVYSNFWNGNYKYFCVCRKVNFSQKMDFQSHHFQMVGKEMLDFMLLDLQGEASLVLHMMLSKLLKILL